MAVTTTHLEGGLDDEDDDDDDEEQARKFIFAVHAELMGATRRSGERSLALPTLGMGLCLS